METRQDRFSGTQPVASKHRFDEAALERYLKRHLDGFEGPLIVREFKGGQSNPTYELESPAGRWVLRRKPPGKLLPSAHAVDREYRVITALQSTDVPVPRTACLCTDDSVIGTWFYVMERVEGRVFWEATLPQLDRAERAAIYDQMNEVLARLHQVRLRGHRARRLRQARQLLRAPDPPLEQAVPPVRGCHHRGHGPSDRLAAAEHPARATSRASCTATTASTT